jgi:hypothetical protein
VTRSIIRVVNWMCTVEPASPHPIYAFECTTCGEQGQPNVLFERARDFTFAHVGRNPSHTGFRETVTRHWRMYGEDVEQPAAAVAAAPAVEVPPARSGAVPCPECRGRGLRVLPTSSAETECSECRGTGHEHGGFLGCDDCGTPDLCAPAGRCVRRRSSAPTYEYGAPDIGAHTTIPTTEYAPVPPTPLGPVDAGAPEQTERY